MNGRDSRNRAFTLIEILIVVVVLVILGAMVIPQFSDASTEAKTSALTTNLATIRGQIQLYKLQHNDSYPTYATFTAQMMTYTDGSGNTNPSKTPTYKYGPYLSTTPNNPFTDTNTLSNDDTATTAWYYNQTSGEFKANDGTYEAY